MKRIYVENLGSAPVWGRSLKQIHNEDYGVFGDNGVKKFFPVGVFRVEISNKRFDGGTVAKKKRLYSFWNIYTVGKRRIKLCVSDANRIVGDGDFYFRITRLKAKP